MNINRNIVAAYYRGALGVFVVYSIVDENCRQEKLKHCLYFIVWVWSIPAVTAGWVMLGGAERARGAAVVVAEEVQEEGRDSITSGYSSLPLNGSPIKHCP